MAALFVVLSFLLATLAAGVLKLLLSARRKTNVVLFIDAPDPDNPAAAVALWKHVLEKKRCGGHLHLVLTGRPVNLRTGKSRRQGGVVLKEALVRQEWETSVPEHAVRVLEDSAARISNYLKRSGVPSSSFTVYDGGVAREAPLSDVVHDWDFIFDRKDIVTEREADRGELLEPSEYHTLVARYSELNEDEREHTFLSLLRNYDLTPLDSLRARLGKPWSGKITIFLGGPATALVKLFKGRQDLCSKVALFYAMFGSLSPGRETLLANQFNAACDLPAAREVFVDGLFPHVTARLVTTETAKQPMFVLSAQEMEKRGVAEHVVKLQRLWESTHGGRAQPMFDVLPVMAATPTYKDCFTWHKMTALMIKSSDKDQEIFTLKDATLSSGNSVYVTDNISACDKESFVQFFVQLHVWK